MSDGTVHFACGCYFLTCDVEHTPVGELVVVHTSPAQGHQTPRACPEYMAAVGLPGVDPVGRFADCVLGCPFPDDGSARVVRSGFFGAVHGRMVLCRVVAARVLVRIEAPADGGAAGERCAVVGGEEEEVR